MGLGLYSLFTSAHHRSSESRPNKQHNYQEVSRRTEMKVKDQRDNQIKYNGNDSGH